MELLSSIALYFLAAVGLAAIGLFIWAQVLASRRLKHGIEYQFRDLDLIVKGVMRGELDGASATLYLPGGQLISKLTKYDRENQSSTLIVTMFSPSITPSQELALREISKTNGVNLLVENVSGGSESGVKLSYSTSDIYAAASEVLTAYLSSLLGSTPSKILARFEGLKRSTNV